jgi:hypothetical protein
MHFGVPTWPRARCAVFAEGGECFEEPKHRGFGVDVEGDLDPLGISKASSSAGEALPRANLAEQIQQTGFV